MILRNRFGNIIVFLYEDIWFDFGCMIDCRLFVENNKENKVIFVCKVLIIFWVYSY